MYTVGQAEIDALTRVIEAARSLIAGNPAGVAAAFLTAALVSLVARRRRRINRSCRNKSQCCGAVSSRRISVSVHLPFQGRVDVRPSAKQLITC